MNIVKDHKVNESDFTKYIFHKQSLLRLLISLIAGFSIATILLYLSYLTYWQRTIFRTQTVDFNILANTLPTKLSHDLINNNLIDLQSTIDSNYGLFGIVVTNCLTDKINCPAQEIKFISKGKVARDRNGSLKILPKSEYLSWWQKHLTTQTLTSQLYFLLRNPEPLTSEIEYKTPHDINIISTGRKNSGRIIGRVYLLRNSPPAFQTSLQEWLSNPASSSSNVLISNGIVGTALTTTLFVWILCELLFYKNKKAIDKINDAENEAKQARIAQIEAENKAKQARIAQIESENLVKQARIAQIEAENKAYRFKALWEGFQESFEQEFSSVLVNKIEELHGLFRRLDNDIDNIVHDFRKAPLLCTEANLSTRIIENLEKHLSQTNNPDTPEIIESLIKFINKITGTTSTINWVINDLRQVANVEAEKINIQSEIEKFINKMPPSFSQSELSIDFLNLDNKSIYILANGWHLRSIIKNVVYNSTAVLNELKVRAEINDREFSGKISISCFREKDYAYIQIKDNGPGFPESIMDTLYQGTSRVNAQNINRGRGSIIVYSYLILHHGKVTLRNLPDGNGAEVTFQFPLAS